MRYHVYQFSDKTDYFEFLGPNLPKIGFWGQNLKSLKSGFGISVLEIIFAPIFRQNRQDNFEYLGSNLPKIGFWGRNFRNLSLNLESTPPMYHVCQFSFKMVNFWFFGLNLGKMLNYVQFRFKCCWGCYRVLGGGWNELGGAGWSWVELGARFSNTYF